MKTYLIGASQIAFDHYIKVVKSLGLDSPADGIDAQNISPYSPIGLLSLLEGDNNPDYTKNRIFARGNMPHVAITFLVISESTLPIRATLGYATIERKVDDHTYLTIITARLDTLVKAMGIPRSMIPQSINEVLDQIREHFITIGLGYLAVRPR